MRRFSRALNALWKSVVLVVAGVLAAFALILVVAVLFGGGIGDPCPPYC